MKKLLPYLALLITFQAFCQEEDPSVYHAKRYLDLNIKSQQKLNLKLAKQQERLLIKLKRKEEKIAQKLERKDSLAYTHFKRNPKNFDSISRVKKPDSLTFVRKSRYSFNKKLDSLQKIRDFAEDKAHVTGEGKNSTSLSGYKDKLHSVKYDAVHHNDIRRQINERTQYLKGIKTKSGKRLPGLKSIQKRSFYSNEKNKTFRQIADEPSIAEEKAFEFLQGRDDFDRYISGNANTNNKQSITELEKLGYQTKQKVQANLQKKIGNDLTGLQKNMGGQVKEYQDKIKKIKEYKNTALQTKSSVKKLGKASKPDFKINPMRSLPFLQRLEQQYNWQTTRANNNGDPAIFNFSYMLGFKHTPHLSYGFGIATSVGLGTSWNNIKLSFEGVGGRSYAAWEWQYGFGAYVGYERMYKQHVFVTKSETQHLHEVSPHNNKNYSEAILLGLTKSYRLNDKMNGSIQILYDIWWKEKGMRSPLLLRFATIK